MTRTLKSSRLMQGFSLLEMAIVLIILGFVLGALLAPLQAQRQQLAQSQTENTLELARRALIGYAQSKGRLPCPATATSNGAELPLGGASCTQQSGFLPAATLGIQPVNANGFAVDYWNNPIRYTVTQVNTGGAATPDFTTSADMANIGISTLAPDLTVLCGQITTTDCNPASPLVSNAVAVIYSIGANGALLDAEVGADEVANKNAVNTFYSRTPTANGSSQGEFDDMVVWISPYVLYNAMIEAGQLH